MPVPTHAARGEVSDSEAGPVAPCRGRSGWSEGSGERMRRDGSQDHPCGPGRSFGPPCPGTLRMPPPGNRVDISPHFTES